MSTSDVAVEFKKLVVSCGVELRLPRTGREDVVKDDEDDEEGGTFILASG